MRATLIGLLASLVAVSGAWGGECRLDGLEARDTRGADRTVYKVIRSASVFTTYKLHATRNADLVGHVYLLVEAGGARHVVDQHYNSNSHQDIVTKSFAPSAPEVRNIPWGREHTRAMKSHFVPTLKVEDGPLSGASLNLGSHACY